MIVAEGKTGDLTYTRDNMLQWGRNMIVAEGPWPLTAPARLSSFNGAAT